MLEKLQAIKERWEEVEAELSNPETIKDMKRFAKLNKEYKDLGKIVDQYHIYRNMVSNIDTNKDILINEKDQELREMAKEELDELLMSKTRILIHRGVRYFCILSSSIASGKILCISWHPYHYI